MDWIIRSNKSMFVHTYLELMLEPIKDILHDYNWIICDLEMNSNANIDPKMDMETDYFILSPSEFDRLLNSHVQFWWGVFLAVPVSKKINLDERNLPYVEGNDLIWKNGNLQYPDAEIEIDCFDSSCTIVKFTEQDLSGRFKNYFGKTATPLEDFNYDNLYK